MTIPETCFACGASAIVFFVSNQKHLNSTLRDRILGTCVEHGKYFELITDWYDSISDDEIQVFQVMLS